VPIANTEAQDSAYGEGKSRNRKPGYFAHAVHLRLGDDFKVRYLSFQNLTSCACSSWLTQTRFSPTPASPPNTIGFTYYVIFPENRVPGFKVVVPSGRESGVRSLASRGRVGTE